jgi:hypothetical protein
LRTCRKEGVGWITQAGTWRCLGAFTAFAHMYVCGASAVPTACEDPPHQRVCSPTGSAAAAVASLWLVCCGRWCCTLSSYPQGAERLLGHSGQVPVLVLMAGRGTAATCVTPCAASALLLARLLAAPSSGTPAVQVAACLLAG